MRLACPLAFPFLFPFILLLTFSPLWSILRIDSLQSECAGLNGPEDELEEDGVTSKGLAVLIGWQVSVNPRYLSLGAAGAGM